VVRTSFISNSKSPDFFPSGVRHLDNDNDDNDDNDDDEIYLNRL
jgi:hypothetical protein